MAKAILSHKADLSSFSAKGRTIRFQTSPYLEKWLSIAKWDKKLGYIAAIAKYSTVKEPVEDYIDLAPILEHLMIDKQSFLSDIDEVEICYEESPLSASLREKAEKIVDNYAFVQLRDGYWKTMANEYVQIVDLENLDNVAIIKTTTGEVYETAMPDRDLARVLRYFSSEIEP
ncbi:MAG: hypothetical protein K6G50_00210 [bacterium]|nr:hypothetical protein [bacterium]